jgi:hypothetical protein
MLIDELNGILHNHLGETKKLTLRNEQIFKNVFNQLDGEQGLIDRYFSKNISKFSSNNDEGILLLEQLDY